jgi:hypothetical protein
VQYAARRAVCPIDVENSSIQPTVVAARVGKAADGKEKAVAREVKAVEREVKAVDRDVKAVDCEDKVVEGELKGVDGEVKAVDREVKAQNVGDKRKKRTGTTASRSEVVAERVDKEAVDSGMVAVGPTKESARSRFP